MKYFLINLICCLFLIQLYAQEDPLEKLTLSTPGQVAALSDGSDNLIGEIVHPLSGQPLAACTDLVVKGAQGIVLSRVYIPPHIPCVFPRHRHHQGNHDRNSFLNTSVKIMEAGGIFLRFCCR